MNKRDSHPLSSADLPQDFAFPGQEETTDPGLEDPETLHEIEKHYENLIDHQTERMVRDTIAKKLGPNASKRDLEVALANFDPEIRKSIRVRVEKIYGPTLRDQAYFAYKNNILTEANSQLKERNIALLEQTETNSLTRLKNREAAGNIFEKNREVQRDLPDSGSIVVVRMDLDGFKKVNDKLGHAAGDTALIEVANKLTKILSGLRPTDVPIHFSGDEFGLILTDVKPGDKKTLDQTVEEILDRVIESIEDIDLPGGSKLTASVGFKIVDREEDGSFAFFDGTADAAALSAKETKFVKGFHSGKNRIRNSSESQSSFLEKNGISVEALDESRLRYKFERVLNEELPDEMPEMVREMVDAAIDGMVRTFLKAKKLIGRITGQTGQKSKT